MIATVGDLYEHHGWQRAFFVWMLFETYLCSSIGLGLQASQIVVHMPVSTKILPFASVLAVAAESGSFFKTGDQDASIALDVDRQLLLGRMPLHLASRKEAHGPRLTFNYVQIRE